MVPIPRTAGFFFQSSLDEAIAALHDKVASGEVVLEGGRFPPSALAILREEGVAQPHQADATAPRTETQRRFKSNNKNNVRMVAINHQNGGFDYGKKVMTQPCRLCGKPVEISGTSVWWGLGKWAKKLDGCRYDYPACLREQDCADDANA